MLSSLLKTKDRSAARMARIARWDRPLRDRRDRLRAWLNMLAVDHGIFRVIYLNEHRVTPIFRRAAQPTPTHLARWAREGVKTVVYLRGGREHGSWPLERDACAAHGMALREFVVRSRGAPERDMLLSAPDFFRDIAYPVAIHCKSGADRAGFLSALFLIVHDGQDVATALKQLSIRYGHFRFAKTGILDAFFEVYAREGEAKGIPFLEWVRDHYDPERLEASFRARFLSHLLVDGIIHRE